MKACIAICIVFFGLSSCKKGDEQKNSSRYYFIAGVKDSTYFKYAPIKIVKGPKIGTDSDYVYNDSVAVDINFDQITDFQFYYYKIFQSINCEPPLDCLPNADRKMTGSCTNNYEIAYDYETSNIRLTYAKLFNYGDTISLYKRWQTGKICLRHDNFSDGYGAWNNIKIGYLGYRKIKDNDTTFGWMEISTYNDTLKLCGYQFK